MTSARWQLSGFGDEIDPDPVVQVAVLQSLGARYIEVRSAWGTNAVDFSADQLAELRRILVERGMGVSAIASPIGKVDIALPIEHEVDRLARAIVAAHALDARYIRVFSFYGATGPGMAHQGMAAARDAVLERMRALADLAEREDVLLVHENEKDIFGDVPDRILDMLESVGSANLRAAWDNANFVQVGIRPFTDAYAKLRPYLDYLQVKDARAATGEVTPAGEGDGQLAETLTALRDDGYSGFASLEPHLTDLTALGGVDGPAAFGVAARAFRRMTDSLGIELA
jgi:sugar phosphate isomerase/epimerase